MDKRVCISVDSMAATPKKDKSRTGSSKKKKKKQTDAPRSHHKSPGGKGPGTAGSGGGEGLDARLARQWDLVTGADELVLVSTNLPLTSRFLCLTLCECHPTKLS